MPLSAFSPSSKNIHIWFSATRAGFCLWKNLLYEPLPSGCISFIQLLSPRRYTHTRLILSFVFSPCFRPPPPPPSSGNVYDAVLHSFDTQHAIYHPKSQSLLLLVSELGVVHHSSRLEERDKYFFQLRHIGASCPTRGLPTLVSVGCLWPCSCWISVINIFVDRAA